MLKDQRQPDIFRLPLLFFYPAYSLICRFGRQCYHQLIWQWLNLPKTIIHAQTRHPVEH